MSDHPERSKRRVYDFLPQAARRGTYLLPVQVHSVLIPCVKPAEVNALELAVLRLAALSCCSEQEVADALCMDAKESSIVHFIQCALAQRGFLDNVTMAITPLGLQQLVPGEASTQEKRMAILMVDEASGNLLPVVLDGNLPSYPLSGNSYTKGRSTICAEFLEARTPPTIPTAADAALALRRMRRENRKLLLEQNHPFLRPAPQENISWQMSEDAAVPAWLALSVRADAYQNGLLVADDFFGRGNSPYATQLVNQHYPQLRAEIIKKQTAQTYQEGDKHKVPGFTPRLRERHPALAHYLRAALSPSLSRSSPLASAYSAAEHAFKALLSEHPHPDISRFFVADVQKNRSMILRFATQLGLQTADVQLFGNLSCGKIRQLLNGETPPTLDDALACCITAAAHTPTHPLRSAAARMPELLSLFSELRHLRNAHKHGKSGSITVSARIEKAPLLVHNMVRLLFPQYAAPSGNGPEMPQGGINEQRTYNAWGKLYSTLGENTTEHLRFHIPSVLDPLLIAMEKQEAHDYSGAIEQVAGTFQELLRQLCMLTPTNREAEMSTMSDIAERCRSCGLLPPTGKLPQALATVSPYFLQKALRFDKATLGACTLAFAALMPAEVLCALTTAEPPIELLNDMARLCRLRGHGNSIGADKDTYESACRHLLTPHYILTLTSSVNLCPPTPYAYESPRPGCLRHRQIT